MIEYRYILVCDNQNAILYGECIEWRTTKFDKVLHKPITIGLPQGHRVYIGSATQRIESVNSATNIIEIELANKRHFLNFDNKFSGFIDLSSDQLLFNPLIDYCSSVDVWVSKSKSQYGMVWRKDHPALLRALKSRFNLDIETKPELAFSFSFYVPERILVDFEFLDKPKLNEKRTPSIARITVLDEFQMFSNDIVRVNIWNNDVIVHIYELPVRTKSMQINLEAFPDEVEFLIERSGQKIYRKKHGFIRSINISGNAIVGSVLLPNGGRQNIIEKMDFVVGDTHE